MNLSFLETELKKRLQYPYRWGRKQEDSWDYKTNFIYKTNTFKELLAKTSTFNTNLKDYALNRWYNFWSAMAVESIFTKHPNIIANTNKYDKLIDFKIDTIPFDHKTSVYPFKYPNNLSIALNNKKDLIKWLYKNQSQESRKHLKNRLFIVLYDTQTKKHWKLKSEITELQKIIDTYINSFNKKNLIALDFGEGTVLSDIIWFVR